MPDERYEIEDLMFQFFLEQQRHQGAGFGLMSEICVLSREHHQHVLNQDWQKADEVEDKMRAKWVALTQKNIMGRTHIKIAEIAATEMLEAFIVRVMFWTVAGEHKSTFSDSDFKSYAETWADVFNLPKEPRIDYQWIIAGWLDAASEIYKMLVAYVNDSHLRDGEILAIWESHRAFLAALFKAFSLYELIASSVIDNGQSRIPWSMTFRGKMQKLEDHVTSAAEKVQRYRERAHDRVDREILLSKLQGVIDIMSHK